MADLSDSLTRPAGTARRTGQLIWPLVLLWLSGVALRLTILALPPVLPGVSADLHLSATDIGLLTSLPPLLFALASVPSALLINRFGAVSTLVAGLLLNAFGAALRGFATEAPILDLSTALMCLGIAVMQPTLPPLVRAWSPTRIGFATAVYTNGLLAGEIVPTAYVPRLTLPLMGGGWHASLAIWALPVVIIAGLVATTGRKPRAATDEPRPHWWPDWSDSRIWRLGLLLGGVNAAYFGLNGFLPGWLNQNGAGTQVQPALVALNLAQIPASLLMLAATDRLLRRPAIYAGGGAILLASIVGVIVQPGPFAVAWAGLFGCAAAMLLTLALTLPATLGEARDAPRLSAAVFTISYGFAMAASLLGGALSDRTGRPVLAFVPFMIAALVVLAFGATLNLASRPSPSRVGNSNPEEGEHS